jgi:hypothetical protein
MQGSCPLIFHRARLGFENGHFDAVAVERECAGHAYRAGSDDDDAILGIHEKLLPPG